MNLILFNACDLGGLCPSLIQFTSCIVGIEAMRVGIARSHKVMSHMKPFWKTKTSK